MEIQNLFELHEFSDHRNSDYFALILKKISRECFFTMWNIVQAKEEQYIQIIFIRNVLSFSITILLKFIEI